MSKLVIYGRTGCPFTKAALDKAQREGREHIFIEVTKCPDQNMCTIFRMAAEEKNHHTVPCIFEVNYVGGYDDYSKFQN